MSAPLAAPSAPTCRIGFAAAVTAHGDGWRVGASCAAWRAGDQAVGDAIFRADYSTDSIDRADAWLIRQFLAGGIYQDRSRAWGGWQ